MGKRKIYWDKLALLHFNQAIQYIQNDSVQNAEKVKKEILGKIKELTYYLEIHSPDKYKKNNSGSYRAFEIHRYRIAYLVKDEEIIIARIRHTSQEPKHY